MNTDILSALHGSRLAHANEAARALGQGWHARALGEPACGELEETYALRHRHLLAMPGLHAQQLATAVGELLSSLRASTHSQGLWVEIAGGAEHHFLLLFIAGQLAGCLRLVARSSVTEERWQSLWQGAA